jgi:hypothetical protein
MPDAMPAVEAMSLEAVQAELAKAGLNNNQ